MPPRATLANLLRDERRGRGLSLRKAAKITGVDPSSLSDYELGVKIPDHATLAKILRGYEVQAEPFLATLDYPVSEGSADISWGLVVRKLVSAGASEDEATDMVGAARKLLRIA